MSDAPKTKATMKQGAIPELSDPVREALWGARELCGMLQRPLSWPFVLAGACMIAPRYPGDHSSGFLRRQLERQTDVPSVLERIEKIPFEAFQDAESRVQSLGSIGKRPAHEFEFASAFIEPASRIAKATTGRTEVRTRHLVGSVLLSRDPGVETVLAELHADPSKIRTAFLEHLRRVKPRDRAGVWASLLSGPSATPLATLDSDSVHGNAADLKDRLDVSDDAKSLAATLLLDDLKLPLSVGLFGGWGAGKSFFMKLLQREVENLSKPTDTDGNVRYCTDVAQIEFNAWHYVDANLWASLVSHIFEELAAVYAKGGKTDLPRARKDLIEHLERSNGLLGSAKTHLEELQRESRQAREDLNEALAIEEEASLLLEELKTKARKQALVEAFQARSDEWSDAVRLPAELAQLRSDVEDLRTAAGRVFSLLSSTASPLMARAALGLLVAILVVPVIAFQIDADFASPVSVAFAQAGAFITFLSGSVAHGRKRLRELSGFLESVHDRADAILQEELTVNDADASPVRAGDESRTSEETRSPDAPDDAAWKAIRGKFARHKKTAERAEAARRRVDRLETEVETLERQLGDIYTGKRLYDFVRDRVESNVYADELGLISLIRKDFESLSRHIENFGGTSAETETETEGTGPEYPRIRRIILYVDDLDRCPEERVVEVLQAVHLLLAFPLFVVVVGVDSRWLLHALEKDFSAFSSSSDDVMPRATPREYLEKIFQIPYCLKPMSQRGFGNLVRNLLRDQIVFDPGATPQTAAATSTPKNAGEPDGDRSEATDGSQLDSQAATDSAESTFEKLRITEREVDWMRHVQPLLDTPRATKQFVNLYRLVRASLPDDRIPDFEGSNGQQAEFPVAQLLLATQIGHPRAFREVLDTVDLSEKTEEFNLPAYVRKVAEGDETPEPFQRLDERMQLMDPAVREAMHQSAETYSSYMKQVGRYSFDLP